MIWLARFVGRLIQVILDIVAALLGIYYSKKYAALMRRLGLGPVASSERRGFIIIQVDGLAYDHLKAAIDAGYAPTLQRLIRRGDFRLAPWRTGIPCTTPAAQAGIMFGNNHDIPAFRWYEKDRGQPIVCSVPSALQAVQQRISANRRGILRGGSSYMNMFDGEAALSMFTVGAMNRRRFFASVRGFGFLLLFLLNPFRTLKIVVLSIWEYLTDLAQRTSARIRRDGPIPLARNFTFLRIMSNVVFREIQTFCVMMDIYRGMPAIYTTYYGYDEVAHHYGPLSRPALRALSAIDSCIHQIDAMRRLALTREYDLYILSDHGLTASEPFQLTFGESVGELLQELVGESTRVSEQINGSHEALPSGIYLDEELQAIEANVSPIVARLLERLRRSLARRLAVEEQLPILSTESQVLVLSSGSMAHVYFPESSRALDLSDIEHRYPRLIGHLLAHPGIWLVIGREQDQVLVLSNQGVLTLDDRVQIEGENPLDRTSAPHWAARQLQRMARFPHSGDLILMGHYDPAQETVTSFEAQWACHGGLGGPQDTAFLMLENHVDWVPGTIQQATDLYKLFSRRYSI